MIPLDIDQRTMAVQALDKNIVVLAGAGTGKTRLLIDRITKLILDKGFPVERLVALTFTKKAAEEMRERLEENLRALSDPRAKTALEDMPKAQIGTIHSFAAHLLRLYPLQAGVDPAFREDEGTLLETVFEREWIRWLKIELGHASPRGAFWKNLLQRVELSDIKTLAKFLVNPHVDLDRLDSKVSVPDIAREIKKEWEEIKTRVEFPSPQRAPSFFEGVSAFEKNLEDALQGRPLKKNLDNSLRAFKSPPQSLKDVASQLKHVRQRLLALSLVDDKLISIVTSTVVPFVKIVRQELNRKGAVSFDGLLVYARNLLRDHVDVREEIKKRFDAYLVDEFQDTDPIQGEILFYLCEQEGQQARDWRDVALAPGRLFLVGDPKQSIYRFRGADIAAFQAFHEHMLKNGAIETTLSSNFRSQHGILDFVNHVFPFVMKKEPFLQAPYEPLRTGLENAKETLDSVEMVVATRDPNPLSSEEGRTVEAEHIGDWISDYKLQGKNYSDIAILLRSSNAFFPYLEALRRRNIPYLVEGEKSFYLTSEIVDFFNLVSCVADPNDTLALVGVMRSPTGGFTDAEILDLKEKGELHFQSKPSIHKKKTEPLFQLLQTFSQMASDQRVSLVIHQLLYKSGLFGGEQAISNLQKVVYLAQKWESEAPLTLPAFVRRLRRYQENEHKEGENPLADVTYDAVKILTIHKAKGLEFPIVFLPNLSAGLNRSISKPIFLNDWRTGHVGLRLGRAKKTNAAMLLLENEMNQREEAEEVRVFFVATTRAKNKMILLRSHGRDTGRFSSYLRSAQVAPQPHNEKILTAGLSIPIKTVVWQNERLLKKTNTPIVLPSSWTPQELATKFRDREKKYFSLLKKPAILTPSKLVQEQENQRAFSSESYEKSPNPTLVGKLCHTVLEKMDFQAPALQLEKAAHLLELNPRSENDRPILEEAEKILKSFLNSSEFQRLKSVTILGREIPFCYETEGEGGDGPTLMRGQIDLLYEDNNQLVVADYKTNNVSKKTLEKTIETYRPQGRVYQDAVKKLMGRNAAFELIFLREGFYTRL